jgi:predicted glycosyltransferase
LDSVLRPSFGPLRPEDHVRKKVLFYCQHLLGVGHLTRSLATCQDLVKKFDVVFLQGGPDVGKTIKDPHFRHVFLMPLLMRETDSSLYDPAGLRTPAELMEHRTREISQIIEEQNFDFVITELFPFGRKKLRAEILGMIDQIRTKNPKVEVYCGLRDILVQKPDGEKRDRQMAEIVNSHYDGVLVHSDEEILPLEKTFSASAMIKDKLHYTGFITESKRAPLAQDRRHDILVSMGGGVVGEEMVLAVARAAAELPEYRFRFFLGPYSVAGLKQDLLNLKATNPKARIEVEGFSKNFEADLEQSALSISLAGYNTLMNTLNTKTMALVYPYMANEEQTLRARSLEVTGAVKVFFPEELTTPRLVELIRRYAFQFPSSMKIDLAGAANTTLFLENRSHE